MHETSGERTRELPLVSVVMAAYAAERFVAEAIESVFAQHYARWELIVIDDGSTDGTWPIIERLAARDPRVRALRNERNQGIVATRNRALQLLDPQCRYVALLDSDDVCTPDRLARQVEFLERHEGHAVVGSHITIIDEDSREIGARRYPLDAGEIRRVITRFNPIAQPGAMVRRSALDAVGHYDPRYPRCQDYDLWLRIAERYDLANLDAFLLRYRISGSQMKQKHLRESIRLTIAIQRSRLFHPRFFRPFNVAYWIAEHALLWLPERFVLWLFMRATYARPR